MSRQYRLVDTTVDFNRDLTFFIAFVCQSDNNTFVRIDESHQVAVLPGGFELAGTGLHIMAQMLHYVIFRCITESFRIGIDYD